MNSHPKPVRGGDKEVEVTRAVKKPVFVEKEVIKEVQVTIVVEKPVVVEVEKEVVKEVEVTRIVEVEVTPTKR